MREDLERVLKEFEGAIKQQEQEGPKRSSIPGKVSLGIERVLMGLFINADLDAYYNGTAEDIIVYQLKEQLFRKEHFPEVQTLERLAYPDFTIASSVLGVPWTPRKGQEPWASGEPPIKSVKDLDERALPDFYSTGIMPRIIRLHKMLKDTLPSSYKILFPGWGRGPIGNAFYLAGAEEALTAMYTDTEYFHKLMRYGMDVMKKYIADRSVYLNEPNDTDRTMFNDEVAAENFSPEMYRELVAPYEKEYFEFFGSRSGFHSCGNTTPLMKEISRTAKWSYFHVSPWSDLDEALRVFPDTKLLVCLHPYRDVLGCKLDEAKNNIRRIIKKCKGREYTIGLDALLPVNGPEKDLQRIKDIWKFCEDTLS